MTWSSERDDDRLRELLREPPQPPVERATDGEKLYNATASLDFAKTFMPSIHWDDLPYEEHWRWEAIADELNEARRTT